MSIEVMKMAVEALEDTKPYRAYPPDHTEIIAALRAAIAEAEKAQPVAWISEYGLRELTFENERLGSLEWEVKRNHERGHDIPLYTHPVPSTPTGYVLVPVEPTQEMLDAMQSSGWMLGNYKALLAAAPKVSAPLTSEGRRQIIYALERQIKALRDHADKLAGSDDPYQAEFPAEDADRLSEAVLHLIASSSAPLLTDKDFDDIMDRFKDAPTMEWRYLVGRAIERRVKEGK